MISLPLEIQCRIFSFLSTPTADIIKQDIQRQKSEYFSRLNTEDLRELYSRLYFTERKWDQVIHFMRQIGPLSFTTGSRLRFIRDYLNTRNIHVPFTLADDRSLLDSDDEDEESE